MSMCSALQTRGLESGWLWGAFGVRSEQYTRFFDLPALLQALMGMID